MPDQTYQLPRDSTMQGIVTQLQNIASRMSSNGSGSGSSYDDTALRALINSKSTVVANPQGTPDGELTAIEIDGDIYEIVSSSGSGSSSGGSGYEATLIYDGSALSSLQSSIELDEEWDNYDVIVFTVNFGSNQSKTSGILYKDMLTANIGKIVGIAGFASVYTGATVNSDKKTFSNIYGGGDIQNIYGVYGLKFGSGGGQGGSGYEETELWSGSPTMSTIQLSDSVLNYDAIYVECMFNGEAIEKGIVYKTTFEDNLGTNYISFCSHAYQYFGINPQSTATSFAFFGDGVNGCVKVVGIKFGGGSSSGETYSRTELFKSSTPQSGVISLSDAIDNYDDIEIVMGWVAASDTASHVERFNAEYFVTSFPYAANPTNANPHALLEMWASNGFSCAVGDDTNTALQTWGHNGSSGIIAVYGIKYSSGSPSSQEEYSTTEKVIGKWIDGKPLYQKTIYSANLGTGMKVPVAHGISNLGVVVGVEASCFDSGTENAWFPASHISTDGYNIGVFSVDGTNINFSNPVEFGSRIINVYATIKYTKTTD